MIAKLLSSRIIDILLIAAAVYFLMPGVRRYFQRRKSVKSQPRYTVITNEKHNAKQHTGKGQYIDYEEVK